MAVNIRAAVSKNISELRKVISEKSSELAQLQRELERHENALQLFTHNGNRGVTRTATTRHRRTNLNTVLGRLPGNFTNKDFLRAAGGLGKSSLYLRQILSRWAKQGRIKRLQRGHYQKAKRANAKRASA
jgi:hypothetical protein